MRTSVVHTTVEVKDDAESMRGFVPMTTHDYHSTTQHYTFGKTVDLLAITSG
jgi:hypothetical protein